MTSAKRKVQIRAQIIVASATIALGLFLYSIRREPVDFWPFSHSVYMITIGLLFLSGTSLFALLYLRGEIDLPFLTKFERSDGPSPASHEEIAAIAQFDSSLENLKSRVEGIEERLVARKMENFETSAADRHEILRGMEEVLPAQIAEEMRLQFEEEVKSSVPGKAIRRIFDASIYRLRKEIFDLSRRANLNLVIGGFTTIAAIGILVVLVLGETPKSTNLPNFLEYYIPRLSTAVFIEIFSFFFLRLYKSSLQEIRYYQDEITRMTLLRVALLASRQNGNAELLSKAIEAIATGNKTGNHEEQQERGIDTKDVVKLVEQTARLVSQSKSESKSR